MRTVHSTVATVGAPKNQTRVSLDEKSARSANLFADNGGIAQLVERLVRNEKARGSNPLTSSLRSRRRRERDCRAEALAKADIF